MPPPVTLRSSSPSSSRRRGGGLRPGRGRGRRRRTLKTDWRRVRREGGFTAAVLTLGAASRAGPTVPFHAGRMYPSLPCSVRDERADYLGNHQPRTEAIGGGDWGCPPDEKYGEQEIAKGRPN